MEVVRQSFGPAVWIVHREELALQAYATASELGIDASMIGASLPSTDTPRRLQICMVQTLLARGTMPTADLAVFDEAHHYAAEEYCRVTQAYPRRVGLTATPARADGRGLSPVFDTLVLGPSVKQLTEMGHLVPCEVLAPAKPLRVGVLAEDPVDAYLSKARPRKTLVFCANRKSCQNALAKFRDAGVNVAFIHGDSDYEERRRVIEEFRGTGLDVIVNVGVLHEGFDAPNAECVILARPVGSPGLFLQVVGRILRPAPNKQKALLLDLWGSIHLHGPPDEERVYSLDGIGISRRAKLKTPLCAVCGMVKLHKACVSCGYETETKVPRVVATPLVKYAAKRRETSAEKAASLTAWLWQARQNQWKVGWAYSKYRAVYGTYPDQEVRRLLK